MNKKGKGETVLTVIAGVGVVGILLVLAFAFGIVKIPQAGVGGTGNVVLTPAEQQEALSMCGSTKQTTVSLNLKNGMNTNTNELFDASYYVFKMNTDGTETQVESGIDTTAGSETLDCGAKYRLKFITDGSTVNSRITSVYTNNAQVDSDGSVVFTTTAPTLTLGMVGSKHALIQTRAYNEEAKAYMFNTGSAVNNQYSGLGVTFTSTVDNATKTTVVAGSSLRVTMDIKDVNTTADYNDYGVYVLVGSLTANTFSSYWDNVQAVRFDGMDLAQATLNSDETKKFSGYNYIFKIPAGKLIDSKTHSLYFDVLKSSGATGDNTLVVAFVPVGNYLSVNGYSVNTAGAKDQSTNPYVYAIFDTNFQVTT